MAEFKTVAELKKLLEAYNDEDSVSIRSKESFEILITPPVKAEEPVEALDAEVVPAEEVKVE